MTAFYSLTIALLGAGAASWLGLPAAALLGSTVCVTLATIARVPGNVPPVLRNLAFAAIGVTLGAGVTPTILQDMLHWSGSLAGLLATVLLTMTISGLVLVRGFGMSWPTAVLSTSPGALAVAVNLAIESAGDIRAVVVQQSIRLLAVTLILPPLIGLIEPGGAVRAAPGLDTIGYGAGFFLLALAMGLGLGLARLRIPAAFLIAGLMLSGAAHYAGWVQGRLPAGMNLVGFAIAGAVIGTRFSGITRAEMGRFGRSAVLVSAVGIGFSAAASGIVAPLLDMPFGQVWVAFAPGGVEAMASMGLSMGYDPIYITSHHIFRLFVLLLGLPVLVRLIPRPDPGEDRSAP